MRLAIAPNTPIYTQSYGKRLRFDNSAQRIPLLAFNRIPAVALKTVPSVALNMIPLLALNRIPA